MYHFKKVCLEVWFEVPFVQLC